MVIKMKETILGAKRSAGDYNIEGKTGVYDNIVLYCSCADSRVEGLAVDVVKLRTADEGGALVSAAGASLGSEAHALKALIGKTVIIDRDAKGRVISADLVR